MATSMTTATGERNTAPNKATELKSLLLHAPSLSVQNMHITTQDGRTRLAPLSFSVQAQARLALIGESGSGKSSVLQAMLGFVPFSGTLMLNDVTCTQAQLCDVRQRIGYLAQSTSLLPMTIANNLRLARSDASDADLQQVLSHVELWELVSQLPGGMETRLGERGQGLSGGQQQRLAIAQLLLRDAPLWLLDEPCAHLDPETATQIFALLGRLSKDKTVLLVSHDLSYVDWVDSVVELNLPEGDMSSHGDGHSAHADAEEVTHG